MISEDLKKAITLAKVGNKEAANRILDRLLKDDPQNELAWVWFIDTITDPQKQMAALENFLAALPESKRAQEAMRYFKSRYQEPQPPVPVEPPLPAVSQPAATPPFLDELEGLRSVRSETPAVPPEPLTEPAWTEHDPLSLLRALSEPNQPPSPEPEPVSNAPQPAEETNTSATPPFQSLDDLRNLNKPRTMAVAPTAGKPAKPKGAKPPTNVKNQKRRRIILRTILGLVSLSIVALIIATSFFGFRPGVAIQATPNSQQITAIVGLATEQAALKMEYSDLQTRVAQPTMTPTIQATRTLLPELAQLTPSPTSAPFSLQVIYEAEDTIYQLKQPGEGQPLTSQTAAYNPHLSPDGKKLAYLVGKDDPQLWLMDLSNPNNPQSLLKSSDFKVTQADTTAAIRQFAWLSDSSRLAVEFVRYTDPPQNLGVLIINSVDASILKTLDLQSYSIAGNIYFSPLGETALLATDSSFSWLDLSNDTYTPEIIKYPDLLMLTGSRNYPYVKWSAEGDAYVATYTEKSTPEQLVIALYQVAKDGKVKALKGPQDYLTAKALPNTAISPDGKSVVYNHPNGLHWFMAGQGADTTIGKQGKALAWSSDGQTCAVFIPGEGGYLFKQAQKVEHFGSKEMEDITSFRWLADGARLYAARQGEQWTLYYEKPGASPEPLLSLPGPETLVQLQSH
jgi:hypothetical protein